MDRLQLGSRLGSNLELVSDGPQSVLEKRSLAKCLTWGLVEARATPLSEWW